jgi:hypothetical protein
LEECQCSFDYQFETQGADLIIRNNLAFKNNIPVNGEQFDCQNLLDGLKGG